MSIKTDNPDIEKKPLLRLIELITKELYQNATNIINHSRDFFSFTID